MSEAEHLERLRADVEVVLNLQLSSFDDAAWKPLADALTEYGFAVMRSWIATGQIFKLAVRGVGQVAPPPQGWMNQDEAESIAGEVVTLALAEFKNEVLAKGVWNPGRGASLTTFFVGQCKLQFPNVYRRWLRAEQHHRAAAGGEAAGCRLHALPPADPAERSVLGDVVSDIFEQMPPLTAAAMRMKYLEDRSYAEIAACLDGIKDARAAENLVSREKNKWRTGKRAS